MHHRDRFPSKISQADCRFIADSMTDPVQVPVNGTPDRGNARAARVNRTHRVVQERAKIIAARRSKIRSLWAPLLIFSTLLVGICIAVWAVLDEYELAAAGTQVSSYQILVPLFWSVPVSAALLAVVWFRQTRDQTPDRARGYIGRG